MKCQKCHSPATLHITEVLGDEQYEELHLCEQCANKYLYEPQQKGSAQKGGDAGLAEEGDEAAALNQRACPLCGIKFVEFRNTGRLGCPHDYKEFRDELLPLLENIHGETKHCGKTPRRQPQNQPRPTHHGRRAITQPHRRPRIFRREESRRENLDGSHASPQTQAFQRGLCAHDRRPEATRDGGPGRALGDDSAIQRDRPDPGRRLFG